VPSPATRPENQPPSNSSSSRRPPHIRNYLVEGALDFLAPAMRTGPKEDGSQLPKELFDTQMRWYEARKDIQDAARHAFNSRSPLPFPPPCAVRHWYRVVWQRCRPAFVRGEQSALYILQARVPFSIPRQEEVDVPVRSRSDAHQVQRTSAASSNRAILPLADSTEAELRLNAEEEVVDKSRARPHSLVADLDRSRSRAPLRPSKRSARRGPSRQPSFSSREEGSKLRVPSRASNRSDHREPPRQPNSLSGGDRSKFKEPSRHNKRTHHKNPSRQGNHPYRDVYISDEEHSRYEEISCRKEPF